MLNWIGAAFIMVSAIVVGLIKREELRQRELELQDFLQFLFCLENSFDCLKQGLCEAVKQALPYCKTRFSTVLEQVLTELYKASGKSASEIWESVLDNAVLAITTEDMAVFRSFGKGLNGNDFSAQKRNVLFTQKEIEKRLDDARESRNVNGKLTLQLSIFGSIAVVLLLL